MPRTVDEAAYVKRREAFLDTAQRLIEAKGYDQMTIQDVLNDLKTSKGAFYHYFDSKQALLEGLAIRLATAAETGLARYVDDRELSAIDKLRQFFSEGMRWKTEQKQLMLAMLPVWVSDKNAIVREKTHAHVVDRIAPLLSKIIRQGVDEGMFTTRYPDQTARMVMALGRDLDDTLVRLLLVPPRDGGRPAAERILAAGIDGLERLLGAPSGSLVLVDTAELQEWFDLPKSDRGHSGDRESIGEQQWHRAVV